MNNCLKIITLVCALLLPCNIHAQQLLWAKTGVGGHAFAPMGTEAWLLQTDRHNNAYVAFSSYSDSIRLGSFLIRNPFPNLFMIPPQTIIAKYDPSGNVSWVAATQRTNAIPRGIATDTLGNLYLYGISYADTLHIAALSIPQNPAWVGEYFLVKFDTSGNIAWIRTGGGAAYNVMSMGAIASDGDAVYISGIFDSATCTIGTHVLTNTHPGTKDIFIAKYDPAGNVLWAKNAGGIGNDEPDLLAVANTGELYLSGSFASSTIAFGSTTLANPAANALFITKYDPLGNALWAKSIAAGTLSSATGLAFDDSDNLYLTGKYVASISLGANTFTSANQVGAGFFAKYDTNGNLDWAKNVNQVDTPFFYGTAVYAVSKDPCNHVWIAGGLADNVNTIMDGHSISPPQHSHDPMFIAEYNTAGDMLTYFTLNSGGDDNVGISADKQGNLYVSGDYIPTLYIGDDSLTSRSNEMFFIAKYTIIASYSTHKKDTVCAQNSIQLNAPSGYLSYEWNDDSTQSFHTANPGDILWVRCVPGCGIPILTDTFNVVKTIPGLPQRNLDTLICRENFAQITLQANAPQGAAILWNDGSTNSSLTVKDTGTYWYTINENQCSITDTITVGTEYCDCWYEIPKAFTPNNDGRNDMFHILFQPACNITNFKLSVYNRWGQQVFASQSPAQGWNGKLNGVDAEIGAYFYTAEFNAGAQNKKHTLKGDITLLR